MNTLLKLDKISKIHGSKKVLENLSLEVRSGDRFFVLGPSGCGKTTLLRIISGLDPDHGGSIEINGEKVSGEGIFIPPNKRGVGYVFQEGALWPHMSVEKHITFGPGSKKRKDWNEYLLNLTGLSNRKNDYPASLSGGEQQRLCLARALSNRPSLLLLDEPLGHLDRNLTMEFREAVLDIVDKTGTTSIFVTHDQEEALSMADRIMLMDMGGPVQTGTPEEVFNSPKTAWAAAFFGPVTRFHATCGPGGKVQTPLGEYDTGFSSGTRCEVVFRALDVQALPGAGNTPANAIRSMFQGDRFLVVCNLSGAEVTAFSPTRDWDDEEENVHLQVKGKPMIFASKEHGPQPGD